MSPQDPGLVAAVVGLTTAFVAVLATFGLVLARGYRSRDQQKQAAARSQIAQLLAGALLVSGGFTALFVVGGKVVPAVLCAALFWLGSFATARFYALEQRLPQIDL